MSHINTENCERSIELANSANVPVNIFINEPTATNPKWTLTAANFMPRKDRVASDVYSVEADSEKEIQEIVQKFIVPLYEVALNKLKTGKDLYYWED